VAQQLGELLERFRHPATPGPPAPAGGVPDDAAADLQAEIRPLIAALDEVEDEARAIVDAAAAAAAAIREQGARDAERILEHARVQAARVRAAPLQDEHDAEAEAILARARSEADGVRQRARARIPGLVARVVNSVRAGVEPAPVREEQGVAGVGRG
jgi:hypothetical protein